MKKILSICIPTLNRPVYLLQAINSICTNGHHQLDEIEICISNNCSDLDYTEVEARIAEASTECTIKYHRHESRIPLDENHHYAKKMASAEHIYFLGDDDFFLRDQIPKLVNFVKDKKPDLAIFNGLIVDSNNCYLGKHFNLPPKEYKTLESAYRELCTKGSFGAVLVRAVLLNDTDFESLYETDHAYGCYWLSIFRMYSQREQVRIYIPNFPCVGLRNAQKTYNHVKVYYKTIPHWLDVCRRKAEPGLPQELVEEHIQSTIELTSSFRFLLYLASEGYSLNLIKNADEKFYRKYWLRIMSCRYFYMSGCYHILKIAYKIFKTRTPSAKIRKEADEIEYLISSVHDQQFTPECKYNH